MDQRLYKATFCLCEFGAVAAVDGNVAKGSCAVVLDIDIGRVEELDKNRDGTCIDELLAIVVCIPSALCHIAMSRVLT